MTWMVVRLVLTLAFVGGVLWFAARLAKKKGLGGGNGLIEVVARQRMGRSSTVSVLRVADRVLVIGSTEEQVTLLAEMDTDVVEDVLAEREAEREAAREAARQAREATLAAVTARTRPAAVTARSAAPAGDADADDATVLTPALPSALSPRRAGARRAPAAGRHGSRVPVAGGSGLLVGSVFDRSAWTSAMEGLRERTVRKP